MPRGSIKWRSGSTGLRSRPFVAEHFAASRNWSRKSINTCKLQTATRGPSSGPPRRIRSSLKSSDYVNVFPGRDTSWGAACCAPTWDAERYATLCGRKELDFDPAGLAAVKEFVGFDGGG